MQTPKPTSAQLALLHVAESGAVSGVLTIIAGVYQIVATHGLDWAALGTFAGTIFLGSLAMIYKSVLSNPNLAQAGTDTLSEVKALLEQAIPYLHTHAVPMPPVPSPAPAPVAVQLAQPSPIRPQITLPTVTQFTAPSLPSVQPPQQ